MRNRMWTESEIDFLVENYLVLGAAGVAKELGRTAGGVWQKVMSPDVRRRVGYIRKGDNASVPDGKDARTIYRETHSNPAVSTAVAENPMKLADVLDALSDLEMVGITEDKVMDLTVDEIMQMRGMAVQMLEIMQK